MRPFLITTSILWPIAASAEVLDKEFSAPLLVLLGLAFAVLAAWTAYKARVVLALLVALFAGVFFWSHLSEVLDPHVSPAMAAEGGASYMGISWAAPAVVVVGFSIGLALRLRRRKSAR